MQIRLNLTQPAYQLKPGHFPKDAVPGVPVETFLRTADDRLPLNAPYSRQLSGEEQLSQHRKLKALARQGLEAYQATGATAPLSLAGLSIALNNRAQELSADSGLKLQDAKTLEEQPLLKRLGESAKMGLKTGFNSCIRLSGASLIGFMGYGAIVLVGTAVSTPTAPLPSAAWLTGAMAASGCLSMGIGAVFGLSNGLRTAEYNFRQPELLRSQAADSEAMASEFAQPVQLLQDWNTALATTRS